MLCVLSYIDHIQGNVSRLVPVDTLLQLKATRDIAIALGEKFQIQVFHSRLDK